MAICEDCNQEMTALKTTTCTNGTIVIDGTIYTRDSRYFDLNERCHDCGIVNAVGNYHHAGCDMERCPKCGRQLIGCDCLDDSDYDEPTVPALGTNTKIYSGDKEIRSLIDKEEEQ